MHTSSTSTRSSLPQSVYFVLTGGDRWKDLIASQHEYREGELDGYREKITTNEDCWVVAPFLGLRTLYDNVFLVDHIVPGEVCVFSGVDVGIRSRPDQCFSIACRSDGAVPELADLRVVQNRALVRSAQDRFIPHWPQPGLIPRDESRGSRVEVLTYMGGTVNLYAPLKEDSFRDRLMELYGVKFEANLRGRNDMTAKWFDYSATDLALALRDIGVEDVKVKPASKLVNAWLAGVPALLGPEPAFAELRKSDLDYVIVRSERDVLAAIERLQSDSNLYRAMVNNGRERAKEYNEQKNIMRWSELLTVDVPPLYQAYQRRTTGIQRLGRLLEFAERAVRFRVAQVRAKSARNQPERLLSSTHADEHR